MPQAARKQGLAAGEIGDWQERVLRAAENGLRARPKDEEAVQDEHSTMLKRGIAELVLYLEILKEPAKHRPFPGEPSES